jgi:hypothetical protein
MFPAGFNQKTAKGGLFVKRNYRIPPRELRGKTLEDSRRLSTEARLDPLTCGASQPPVITPVLHHLLGCISVVISSQFDLRAED